MKKQQANFSLLWLKNPHLQAILHALNQGANETRIVGGAVRNSMLGLPLTDIDLATTCKIEEIVQYLNPLKFKIIPTGVAHGTITVATPSGAFEITRLRKDIATDGRHAQVSFEASWEEDAKRRDFTMNALYLDSAGYLYDYVGSITDIEAKLVRFIGEPNERIQEDYLRILRFFRFYAYYSSGQPDKASILSCAAHKNGLYNISAERIWAELKKLLNAPDPRRALLWMRQSGVLGLILPESQKWGIDAIHNLIASEQHLGQSAPDNYLLRLEAIIPKNSSAITSLSARLKLANIEKKHLLSWAAIEINEDNMPLNKLLYAHPKRAIEDNLRLLIAKDFKDKSFPNKRYLMALNGLSLADKPVFPICAQDLLKIKPLQGPAIGQALEVLKQVWLNSDCIKTREELLELFVNSKQ